LSPAGRDSRSSAVPRGIDRSIDHPAVLLPETRRSSRSEANPARLGRILFGFVYVTVTACAIVLLGLSWRNEVHKRQAAETAASKSGSALSSVQARVDGIEEQNRKLSARVTDLSSDLRTARSRLSRRTPALQQARGTLRSAATLVSALDGLDEMIGDTLKDQEAIGRLKVRLDRHVSALDRYIRVTNTSDLEKSELRATVRLLTKDLLALRAVLVRIAERKEALGDTVEPLGQSKEIDQAIKVALARAKTALRP
jgi:hypothetical protein